MNFNLHDLVLLAPEDFLLGATCAILFIDLFLKQSRRVVTHWLSIAALLGIQPVPETGEPDLLAV